MAGSRKQGCHGTSCAVPGIWQDPHQPLMALVPSSIDDELNTVFYYGYIYIYFTVRNIKKTEFYLEGLLHEIGLMYIRNKLHQRKCFVRILFTC